MTKAQRIAKVYRRQYHDSRAKKWKTYEDWQIQPEAFHRILLELKTKEAVDLLLGSDSWTRRRWDRKQTRRDSGVK